jgi:hypothetical protein
MNVLSDHFSGGIFISCQFVPEVFVPVLIQEADGGIDPTGREKPKMLQKRPFSFAVGMLILCRMPAVVQVSS